MADILIEAQRASHVAVHQAAPIVHVLLPQRNIQPVGMTRRGDVSGYRSFAQHLLDGIARHQVNQQEDHRHYQPDHGQHVQRSREQVAH